MKILELRFKNLNSLYGEWCIDFTDPEYVSNGIFALTGPTGAGKSTILDAVCLALYGATPRLGRITKSGNEIMSRQTGECYAEVLFESQMGSFRCHWEQRRARKRTEGVLQDQEHWIADAETGQPIETMKSMVVGAVEEKTGMDFERFTRSILLAQGGFDTFLKADAEQKSKILEQITGTEIYSEISRRVYARQRSEREQWELLKAETRGIAILTPEEEKEIEKALGLKRKEEKTLNGELTKMTEGIRWLTVVEELKREIGNLNGEAEKLQTRLEEFKPQRNRLMQAAKAAALDGIYATLAALRKQQVDDQTGLKSSLEALPELEHSAQEQAKALKTAEQHASKNKENLRAYMPLIQKVRSLDQKIEGQEIQIKEISKNCALKAEEIKKNKQARETEGEKRIKVQKQLESAEQYLKDHAPDEWLIGGLAAIEEQFANLLAKQKEITQKASGIKDAGAALAQAKEKLGDITRKNTADKQRLDDIGENIQKSEDALSELLGGKSLREYRTEREAAQKENEYLLRIAALEAGKPCPLCGSTEHPYAAGDVEAPDEIEQKIKALTALIAQAEEREADFQQLKEAETVARQKMHDSEVQKNNVINNKQGAEEALTKLNSDLEKLRSGFGQLKQAVSQKLQPLGIVEIREEQLSPLLASLKSRLQAWKEQTAQESAIKEQIAGIDKQMEVLSAAIAAQDADLAEKQGQLEQLKKEHAAQMHERNTLYGDKKPDDEENRLKKAVEDAEKAEKEAGNLHAGLQQKLTAAKTRVEDLRKRIGEGEPEIKTAETDFSTKLEAKGFADEEQFHAARLSNEERESLSAREKALDGAQKELKTKQQERKIRLDNELAKKITDKTIETLGPLQEECKKSLEALHNSIAQCKHSLEENAKAEERRKQKQAAIELQEKEYRRWEKLDGLIGSADGKKYRNFAQGLTFEVMVLYANRQLAKMTDRYLLERDGEQPLELNVVDNYQGGEIRSTKNLSGGESFIVSLTLALGLSKMASQKVRVDSLFLDEGFGTLDEETLETALETLSELQQDGKLIGVISHITALKERISTQINIAPVSGGRSALSGPGCRQEAKRA